MPLPAPSTLSNPRSQIGSINHANARSPVRTEGNAASKIERPTHGSLSVTQSEVDAPKRRLVPPRYSTRLSTLTAAAERDTKPAEPTERSNHLHEGVVAAHAKRGGNADGVTPTRLRPRSMYQSGSTFTQPSEDSKKPTSSIMRPPAPVQKLSETSASGLSRTQSLRKSGVPRPPISSTGSAAHARTQSGSNIAVSRKDFTRLGPSSDKPKSHLTAPSTKVKNSSVSGDAVPDATRTSGRLAGLRRAASIKSRPELDNGTSTTAASRPDDPPIASSNHRELILDDTKRISRPAFSTLQQHFTPRKTGKAPTATFLHPVQVSGSQALPPDIVTLQTELLQLHLLHKSSAIVNKCWESSVKRSLSIKFQEVGSLYQTMLEHERNGQEQRNLQSLIEWTCHNSSTGLVEYIQILSGPLHELPSLSEPGGRLDRLADDFCHWAVRVQATWDAREQPTAKTQNVDTVDGLEDTWKAENAALVRKLTSFARDIDVLTVPSPGSSIACLVDSCKAFLSGVLDELCTMQAIEVDVVARERVWLEDRLRAIARESNTCALEAQLDDAIWRE